MKKYISNFFIQGILYFLLAILLLFRTNLISWLFVLLLCILLFIHLLANFISFIRHKPRKIQNVLIAVFDGCLLGLFAYNYEYFYSFLTYIFGWFALVNALIKIINSYVYHKDQLDSRGWVYIDTIINLLMSILLLSNPSSMTFLLKYFLIGYLFYMSIANLLEFSYLNYPLYFVSALIPMRALNVFNDMFKTSNPKNLEAEDELDQIQVFVHLSENGFEKFGHVDICFHGYVYSYGCHDPKNRSLGGSLGDGVFFIAEAKKFIEYTVSTNHTLYSFTLNITKEQHDILLNRLDDLLLRATLWKCEYQDGQVDQDDYASLLAKNIEDITFYKFKKGKFKTYFVMTTNCVLLADYLIRNEQLDLINNNGILTPGAYIHFLSSAYHNHDGSVTKMKVYGKDRILNIDSEMF